MFSVAVMVVLLVTMMFVAVIPVPLNLIVVFAAGAKKPVPVSVTIGLVASTALVGLMAVSVGTGLLTVSVKLCVAFAPTPFWAVIVMANVPLAVAVPLSTPAAVSVTPEGRVLGGTENVGAGKPVAVIVNVPAVPAVKVVLAALVIAGAWSTVSVNACVVVPAVFVALIVMA